MSSANEYTGTVSRYGVDGWIEDLQDLNIGRDRHACTSYRNNDNVRVNLVCGGYTTNPNGGGRATNTCEINLEGSNTWTMAQPLPLYNTNFRLYNIDNHVFMIGETFINF